MLELALIALSAIAPGPAGSVQGTIVSEGTGEPLAGVHVTLASGARVAISEDDGTYAIAGLPPGSQTLRFAQFGYHDLTIDVVVPSGGSVRLDVQLRPRPIAVPAISVVAGVLPHGGGDLMPPGSRRVSFSGLDSRPLSNEPDVLRSLEAVPGIDVSEAFATALHVRGGAADQNQILLDGVPVYNAVHSSGVFSGINPDAVADVAVHAGVAPARYGGGLSSVVDVTAHRPGLEGFAFRGGLGLGDLRSTVETPLPGGGGLLLAGRRTTYDLVERGSFDRGATTSFDELLAKLTVPALGGEIDVLSLHGSNGVSYFADPGLLEDAPVPVVTEDRYNRARWTTGTDALTWRWSDGGATEVRASAWRAETETWGEWSAADGQIHFDHGLTHLGFTADVTKSRPWGSLHAGLGIEHVSSSYTTLRAAADSTEPVWHLAPDALWASAFVDHRWIPHDRWLVDNGLRLVAGVGGGLEIEPRVSVHYRPGRRVALSLGYARHHQHAQSLRNEESPLHAAFGFEPLVAADGGVPVARSDQVTGTARIGLTDGLDLEVDAYTRKLHGLVLVAPATGDPFAVDAFADGHGKAVGLGAALSYRGVRTELDLAGEWSATEREAALLEYHPTFEQRSVRAGISRALGRILTVRAAFRAAAGRPTSGLTGGFAYEPFDPFTGEVEFAGTPQRREDGALNAERLPVYVRLDVGARRTWRPSLLGAEGTLVTWFDVLNVLNRKNPLALQENPEGWSALTLGGLSAAFGVQWSF